MEADFGALADGRYFQIYSRTDLAVNNLRAKERKQLRQERSSRWQSSDVILHLLNPCFIGHGDCTYTTLYCSALHYSLLSIYHSYGFPAVCTCEPKNQTRVVEAQKSARVEYKYTTTIPRNICDLCIVCTCMYIHWG